MNIIKPIFFIFFLMLLAVSNNNATLYKWVDKKGRIQFSDKKPLEIKAVDLDKKSHKSKEKFNIPNIKPIGYNHHIPSKIIQIEKITFKSQKITFDSIIVGHIYKGTRCNKEEYPIKWNDMNRKISSKKSLIKKILHQRLKELNYSLLESTSNFLYEEEKEADISLIATVVEAEFKICVHTNVNYSSSNYSRYSSNYSNSYKKKKEKIPLGKGYLKVHWQVFDNLHRKIIYETTTQGKTNWRRYTKNISKAEGFTPNFTDALLHSMNALFAEQDFIKQLRPLYPKSKDKSTDKFPPLSLKISYGDHTGNITQKMPKIKQTSVTVRTKSGHGSGFVLTSNGYIITNQHVVENNKTVIVIINDQELEAEVLRSDKTRDVALLRIKKVLFIRAAKISKFPPNIGENTYVIGTPLDEAFSNTVTKGIISSHRKLVEKMYYQTDAAINKGNSGGAAFNDNGEVIGIAVAGVFTQSGGSLNINFLIPIEEVFEALLIKHD